MTAQNDVGLSNGPSDLRDMQKLQEEAQKLKTLSFQEK